MYKLMLFGFLIGNCVDSCDDAVRACIIDRCIPWVTDCFDGCIHEFDACLMVCNDAAAR